MYDGEIRFAVIVACYLVGRCPTRPDWARQLMEEYLDMAPAKVDGALESPDPRTRLSAGAAAI
jgi:hypothetical protein